MICPNERVEDLMPEFFAITFEEAADMVRGRRQRIGDRKKEFQVLVRIRMLMMRFDLCVYEGADVSRDALVAPLEELDDDQLALLRYANTFWDLPLGCLTPGGYDYPEKFQNALVDLAVLERISRNRKCYSDDMAYLKRNAEEIMRDLATRALVGGNHSGLAKRMMNALIWILEEESPLLLSVLQNSIEVPFDDITDDLNLLAEYYLIVGRRATDFESLIMIGEGSACEAYREKFGLSVSVASKLADV